jgi:hypothetical protein
MVKIYTRIHGRRDSIVQDVAAEIRLGLVLVLLGDAFPVD